jgi:hypothetical protein
VWGAAALLLKRHGQKAPEVAMKWSKDFTVRKDLEAAALCAEIADAASEIQTEAITPAAAREPALTEILSGAVTGEVMRADRVERRDVEKLMKETKRRQSSRPDLTLETPSAATHREQQFAVRERQPSGDHRA